MENQMNRNATIRLQKQIKLVEKKKQLKTHKNIKKIEKDKELFS